MMPKQLQGLARGSEAGSSQVLEKVSFLYKGGLRSLSSLRPSSRAFSKGRIETAYMLDLEEQPATSHNDREKSKINAP